ncbi:Hypothetical protein SMAX5B_001860 [Scophthalmus maximus]|uniref:Uncharacterized protein n=1 Tax=Scophthalmus maximus TaxID=52904 RepID=A0A2U9BPU6_SCOMX|nr:Hypothetical protein SMAX5B_001860 [Scophthalmus maximus]KAF0037783.1 hypothetical protein F2P81_010657 [Scophthalmus maximus]
MFASSVLIRDVTLLKDSHHFGPINFLPAYEHQTSLCRTPPPPSSGSVDRTDDSIDYGASVSEPRAEESDEGKGEET